VHIDNDWYCTIHTTVTLTGAVTAGRLQSQLTHVMNAGEIHVMMLTSKVTNMFVVLRKQSQMDGRCILTRCRPTLILNIVKCITFGS